MRYLIILFLFVASSSYVQAQVAINEVYANPTATSDKSEWLELVNYSNLPINLLDYTIDGASLPSYSLTAGGYVVITKTLADFNLEFPTVSNVVQLSSLSLANTQDTITLKKGAEVIDVVNLGASPGSGSWTRSGPLCNDWEWQVQHTAGTANINLKVECFNAQVSEIGWECKDAVGNWVTGFSVKAPYNLDCRLTNYVGNVSYLVNELAVILPVFVNELNSLKAVINLQGNEFSLDSSSFNLYSDLQVVQVLPNPTGADSGQEWVQIYNPNNYDLNLQNYSIHDSQEKLGDLSGTIAKNSGLKVVLPGSALNNCSSSTSCNEQVSIKYNDLLLDSFSYTTTKEGVAWQKINNGWWQVSLQNLSNLLFTEAGEYWLEFYNPATYPISVNSLQLKVNGEVKDLPGLYVSPQSYYVWKSSDAISNTLLEIASTSGVNSAVIKAPMLNNNLSYGLIFKEDEYLTTWQDLQPTPGQHNKVLPTNPVVKSSLPQTDSKIVPSTFASDLANSQNNLYKLPNLQIIKSTPGSTLNIATWYIPVWQILMVLTSLSLVISLYLSGIITWYLNYRFGQDALPTVPRLRLGSD